MIGGHNVGVWTSCPLPGHEAGDCHQDWPNHDHHQEEEGLLPMSFCARQRCAHFFRRASVMPHHYHLARYGQVDTKLPRACHPQGHSSSKRQERHLLAHVEVKQGKEKEKSTTKAGFASFGQKESKTMPKMLAEKGPWLHTHLHTYIDTSIYIYIYIYMSNGIFNRTRPKHSGATFV